MTISYAPQTVVDAIRLALEGAASDEVAVATIRELAARAPASDPDATEPTVALLDAIRSVGQFHFDVDVPIAVAGSSSR